MKILAIGDFHGKFPKKFETLIKKEKIDLVVSIGDYPPFHYRKLWFKHCYGKEIELWKIIGKKKYKELINKDLKEGEKAIKKLNSLKVPVITIVGNLDYSRIPDALDETYAYKKWKWDSQNFFKPLIKKYPNIKDFTYSYFKFKDYVFIGGGPSSFPGKVKSKNYRKFRKKLDNLFKRFRKENKKGKVIFVSHNVPYNTKLDKLSIKAVKFAVRSAGKNKAKQIKSRKKHYGSKLVKRIVQRYQPLLHVGGHIHESLGKDRIGKTILVNPGAANEGKAAIIELYKGKVKKIKFLK